jgi:hypothetical protein
MHGYGISNEGLFKFSLNLKFFSLHKKNIFRLSMNTMHIIVTVFVLILFFRVYNNLRNIFSLVRCQNTTNNFPVEIKFYGNKFALTQKKVIFGRLHNYFIFHGSFHSFRYFLIIFSGYLHWHTSNSSILQFFLLRAHRKNFLFTSLWSNDFWHFFQTVKQNCLTHQSEKIKLKFSIIHPRGETDRIKKDFFANLLINF